MLIILQGHKPVTSSHGTLLVLQAKMQEAERMLLTAGLRLVMTCTSSSITAQGKVQRGK